MWNGFFIGFLITFWVEVFLLILISKSLMFLLILICELKNLMVSLWVLTLELKSYWFSHSFVSWRVFLWIWFVKRLMILLLSWIVYWKSFMFDIWDCCACCYEYCDLIWFGRALEWGWMYTGREDWGIYCISLELWIPRFCTPGGTCIGIYIYGYLGQCRPGRLLWCCGYPGPKEIVDVFPSQILCDKCPTCIDWMFWMKPLFFGIDSWYLRCGIVAWYVGLFLLLFNDEIEMKTLKEALQGFKMNMTFGLLPMSNCDLYEFICTDGFPSVMFIFTSF